MTFAGDSRKDGSQLQVRADAAPWRLRVWHVALAIAAVGLALWYCAYLVAVWAFGAQ